MPYIKQDRRRQLSHDGALPQTPGELNYVVTNLMIRYLRQQDDGYTTINDILGALEGAKLEFYARVVRPFENEKIKQNGDVY